MCKSSLKRLKKEYNHAKVSTLQILVTIVCKMLRSRLSAWVLVRKNNTKNEKTHGRRLVNKVVQRCRLILYKFWHLMILSWLLNSERIFGFHMYTGENLWLIKFSVSSRHRFVNHFLFVKKKGENLDFNFKIFVWYDSRLKLIQKTLENVFMFSWFFDSSKFFSSCFDTFVRSNFFFNIIFIHIDGICT